MIVIDKQEIVMYDHELKSLLRLPRRASIKDVVFHRLGNEDVYKIVLKVNIRVRELKPRVKR